MARFIMMLITLLISFEAFAYELLTIQALSETKKTFITRTGKRQGIIEGVTHNFTADDVAVIARARKVTGQYTQWELVNTEMEVPFYRGQLVTSHPAQEYLWALSPEKDRQKYMKQKNPYTRHSLIAKGGIMRGLSESVSEVEPQDTQRGSILGEILYEHNISEHFYFDIGSRYEKETINVEAISLTTIRALLVTHILYYFEPWQDFYKGRFYIGAGAGWGRSYTKVGPAAQSGSVTMVPEVKLGMTLPFNADYDFLFETSFESMQTIDRLQDGSRQTTNESNAKMGVGLRKFF